MRDLIRAAIVAALLLSGSGASAEPQCNLRSRVLQQLWNKYGEVPVAVGVTHNGGLIEVIAGDGGMTWSIIITAPSGMACLIAAGEGWRVLRPLPEGPPV